MAAHYCWCFLAICGLCFRREHGRPGCTSNSPAARLSVGDNIQSCSGGSGRCQRSASCFHTATANVSIEVTGVNEHTPFCSQPFYTAVISATTTECSQTGSDGFLANSEYGDHTDQEASVSAKRQSIAMHPTYSWRLSSSVSYDGL